MKSAKKQRQVANIAVFTVLGLVFVISIFPVLYTLLGSFKGNMELLTPLHILLYQLVWFIPGWIVTMWTRAI